MAGRKSSKGRKTKKIEYNGRGRLVPSRAKLSNDTTKRTFTRTVNGKKQGVMTGYKYGNRDGFDTCGKAGNKRYYFSEARGEHPGYKEEFARYGKKGRGKYGKYNKLNENGWFFEF